METGLFPSVRSYEISLYQTLQTWYSSGKFSFFNESGTVAIKPRYDFSGPFQNGRAPVCEGCKEEREGEYTWFTGGRWGFIDITGKIVIPLEFDEVEPFRQGKARGRQNGQWVVIDREGKRIFK